MNEAVKFLSENPVVYLGTVDAEGNPRVRPFQFMLEEGGKLYFCTSNEKEVYSQIKNNPEIELSVMSKEMAWIRVRGRVVFSDCMTIKEKVLNSSSLVRAKYQRPDNPVFEVFYLTDGEATIADFSGNPPKTYRI